MGLAVRVVSASNEAEVQGKVTSVISNVHPQNLRSVTQSEAATIEQTGRLLRFITITIVYET